MNKIFIGFGPLTRNMNLAQSGEGDFAKGWKERRGWQLAQLNESEASAQEGLDGLIENPPSAELCFLAVDLAAPPLGAQLALAKELRKAGKMVIALAAAPFNFEKTGLEGEEACQELEKAADAWLLFDNEAIAARLPAKSSLAKLKQAGWEDMRICAEAIGWDGYDLADLRASLRGRVYYGIGRSAANAAKSCRQAEAALRSALPPGFRVGSVMLGIFRDGPFDELSEAASEAMRRLGAEDALKLASFHGSMQQSLSGAVLLACGKSPAHGGFTVA